MKSVYIPQEGIWVGLNSPKLVMPEREVGVCSADEAQQARNSCPELHHFSHGITWSNTFMYIHMHEYCTICDIQ